MTKHILLVAAICIASAITIGCSGGDQLPPQDESTLKNNMTRELTDEERGKLGGSSSSTPTGDDKGLAPPPGKGPR